MGHTIGIISIKGGVGKTTIASSLASDLSNHFKKKVLLIDANYSAPNLGLHMDIVEPESSIHHVLEGKHEIRKAIHNRFGVDVIPGSYVYDKNINYLKLKDRLAKIKNSYDFVVLDSSPSLNEEVLSTILASDSLFVVSTPDYPTLSCSLKAARLAKQRGKPIEGMIINKIRNPVYELTLKEIEETTGVPVVARLPDDKNNGKAVFTRIPTPLYKRNCKFSKEISRLSCALTGNKERKKISSFFLPESLRKEEVNRQLLKESFYTRVFSDFDDQEGE